MEFIRPPAPSNYNGNASNFISIDLPPAILIILYVFAVSLFTFSQFGWDKMQASNRGRRTPEATLLLWSVLGGAFGAKVGQWFFRHKTQKEPFRTQLNTVTFFNICVIAGAIGIALVYY